jgi:hypothetical protein
LLPDVRIVTVRSTGPSSCLAATDDIAVAGMGIEGASGLPSASQRSIAATARASCATPCPRAMAVARSCPDTPTAATTNALAATPSPANHPRVVMAL